jgi:hypothetical protein
MLVHRTTLLPIGPNRGRLFVPESVANETGNALQLFHGRDGRHEGLVYWAGVRKNGVTTALSMILPLTDHSSQRVMASEAAVGSVSRKARSIGLSIVAQVHTHGGNDTRHSDGDDYLVLMPFEGFYSLVVGGYGDSPIRWPGGLGLHQYQDRRWMQIDWRCADAFTVVPTRVVAL